MKQCVLVLRTMNANGSNKTQSVNVRMEPRIKDLLNRLAVRRGSTPSQLSREGILMLLEKEGYVESSLAKANKLREAGTFFDIA